MKQISEILSLLCVLCWTANSTGKSDVVITLVSRSTSPWRVEQATARIQQWNDEGATALLSTQLSVRGEAWTLTPLLKPLTKKYPNTLWFVIVSEWTLLNVQRLHSTLSTYDHKKEWFLGHSVDDDESIITHHYKHPHSLDFPILECGIVLSAPALKRIATISNKFAPSFNIDPAYEFALFLKYLHTPVYKELFPNPSPPPTDNIVLTHLPTLCSTHLSDDCDSGIDLTQQCGDKLSIGTVFFAVKTCTKFQETRLPVVWETWGRDVPESAITYFSDFEVEKYRTVSLGVHNTDIGHCGKTEAILRWFTRQQKSQDWLVIADDDTLLSVDRLLEVLSCYDPSRPLLMGEVYGYLAHTEAGFNFITGGGGMVLSAAAVRSFASSDRKCPSIDYADDMFLGMSAHSLDWDLTHSPLFHQDQPRSYPAKLLTNQRSVSFHRHSPMNPHTLYKDYLTHSHTSHTHPHISHIDRTEL